VKSRTVHVWIPVSKCSGRRADPDSWFEWMPLDPKHLCYMVMTTLPPLAAGMSEEESTINLQVRLVVVPSIHHLPCLPVLSHTSTS
jgi:hypothetical protein